MSNPEGEGATPRKFRVPCRVLVEGYVEVNATGPRSARTKALALIGGKDAIEQIASPMPIAHDAVTHKDIEEVE